MKTALITGANKSIGFEAARQLAAEGVFIYLGSRDMEKGELAAAKLKAEGYEHVTAVRIDVTDTASIAAAKKEVERRSGSLDILINNAGISGGFPQPPSRTGIDIIRRAFETNFFGTISVTQHFLELLQCSGSPRIVNVTSGLASLTMHSHPDWQYYAIKGAGYGPSKTALNAYTLALAYELRDTPFKVNAVDPGFTATDFNNHRGTGKVEDAAAIIVRYALLQADGPTGRFFSNDSPDDSGEMPW